MNAILLSAGFGTRFKPYTNHFAKASIPFLNIPSIAYSLYYCAQFNINKVVVNTHHLPDSIETAINSLNPKGAHPPIEFLHETPNILDSGGGMKNAESTLAEKDCFLSFNTDIPHIITNLNIDELVTFHLERKSLITFVTTDKEGIGTKFGGLWTQKDNSQIVDFGKKETNQERGRHYCGILIASKKLFEYQKKGVPQNIIYDVALPLLKEGKETFHCFHIDDHISFETGNVDDYLESQFYCLEQIFESKSIFSKEIQNILTYYQIHSKFHKTNNGLVLSFSKNTPKNLQNFVGKNIIGSEWPKNLENLSSIQDSVIYGNQVIKLENSQEIKLFL